MKFTQLSRRIDKHPAGAETIRPVPALRCYLRQRANMACNSAAMIKRARELAAAGCDPQTINVLLVAEGHVDAEEVLSENFSEELKQISRQVRKGRDDAW